MYLFSSPNTNFLHSQPPIKIPIQKRSNYVNFNLCRRNLRPFSRQPCACFRKSDSETTDKVRESNVNVSSVQEDFVTRVLKENPYESGLRYLRGGKLYVKENKIPKKVKGDDLSEVKVKGDDLFEVREKGEDLFEVKEKGGDLFEAKEKGGDLFEVKEKGEDLSEVKEKGEDLFEVKEKREDLSEVKGKGEDEKRWDFGDEKRWEFGDLKLKDMLKDFRGKLYVPEQAFGVSLSEEEEFNRSFRSLPKMKFENFMEALREGRIRFMTYKNDIKDGWNEFIFELEDIPAENDIKSMHRTKWAMVLDEDQAIAALDEYNGPRYKIETRLLEAWVAKLPDYPHPVASSIANRVIVEFGVLTTVLTAAIPVAVTAIGRFLPWAVSVVTTFLFLVVYDTLAICIGFLAPLLGLLASVFTSLCTSLYTNLFANVLQVVKEDFTDWVIGGLLFRKLKALYIIFSVSDNLKLLGVIMIAVPGAALYLRLNISKRSKDFRKWDIWQGIEFSQSKAHARVDGSTEVTFKDVAGIDSAVEELQELVRYLKNPELFEKIGIKPPHGVLLEGPPGCGKTLIAKAIAGEAGVPFYQMAGSEFVEVLVGVGSARVRDLFKRAKANKPSVIFIDEIDALATRRQGIIKKSKKYIYDAATQERETTLNQLLIELDGFDTGKGVIFLGATNRKDLLDPALLRPGRFDRKIKISPPDAKGRLDILKVHARKVKLSDSVDLSSYAQDLPGWSGAKLAQLLQEAALVAVRKKHKSIVQSDLDDAFDRLTLGPKQKGVYLDYQGQCRRALTDAGVAVVSHLLRLKESANVERCDRISLHPRGETLSQIVFHRLDEESLMYERLPQLLQRMQVLLGGRAAEEVIFGRDTSVASAKYLAHASWLARKIISGWNLENPMVIHGETPPWTEKNLYVGPRLDFEGSIYRADGLSAPPLNFKMDDEIALRAEELMRDMYDKTVSLLSQHNAALLKTVKVLVTQLEISGEEIDYILEHYPANTPPSLILEEGDPGGLPLFHKQNEEQSQEAEYELLPQ